MRRFTALLLIICATPLWAQEKVAYIIVQARASAPADIKQPDWIAFVMRGPDRWVHVPNDLALFEIPAGRYELSHVDFGRDYQGRGHWMLHIRRATHVDLAPDTVTYLGIIDLKVRRGIARHHARLLHDQNLLRGACKYHKATLEALPFVFAFGPQANRPKKIRCEVD